MRRLALIPLLITLVGLVGCDHATKYSAKTLLQGQAPVVLVKNVLDLRYVENTDTGFNALSFIPPAVRKPLLLASGLLMVLLLGVVVLGRSRWLASRLTPLERLAAFFALAGGLGNVGDRLARGYVVDFVHLHHWPVFNVADVYLGLAIGLVVLAGLRTTWLARRQT